MSLFLFNSNHLTCSSWASQEHTDCSCRSPTKRWLSRRSYSKVFWGMGQRKFFLLCEHEEPSLQAEGRDSYKQNRVGNSHCLNNSGKKGKSDTVIGTGTKLKRLFSTNPFESIIQNCVMFVRTWKSEPEPCRKLFATLDTGKRSYQKFYDYIFSQAPQRAIAATELSPTFWVHTTLHQRRWQYINLPEKWSPRVYMCSVSNKRVK